MLSGIVGSIVLLALAPFVAGFLKKVKALFQSRRGSTVWQPYYDLYKLLHKDSVVSSTTSQIFIIAPYGYFASAVTAAGLVFMSFFGETADFILLIYVLALGRFCLALASLDAGSAFGGMGGSREMYITVLVEPALFLALLTVAMPAQSTALSSMMVAASRVPFTVPYVLAAAAFVLVALAETGRIPVDNPDTHLELTMVHEGMILEYSGRELALIHWATMIKQLVVLLLFACLFVPWLPVGEGLYVSVLWLVVKILFGAVLLAVIETSTNKLRLFKLPGLLAVSALLSVLALIAQ